VYMTVPIPKRNKLEKRSIEGWYVGPAIGEPGVRMWLDHENDVAQSSHVHVVESEMYQPTCSPPAEGDNVEVHEPFPAVLAKDQEHVTNVLEPLQQEVEILPPHVMEEYEIEEILDSRHSDRGEEFLIKWKGYDKPEDNTWEPLKNLRDTAALDVWESKVGKSYRVTAAHAPDRNISVPATARIALAGPDHEQWLAAMERELEAIKTLQTWDVVPRPRDRKVISAKWVFAIKNLTSGTPLFKARLVARGFTQVPGVDYDVTYAPTVSRTALRIVLALAVNYDMLVHVVDCKNAFLNGCIDRDIYVEQPPFFPEAGTTTQSHVCKLNKALYGLKQSPLIWNQALHAALVAAGFERMDYEQCVYVYRSRGGKLRNLNERPLNKRSSSFAKLSAAAEATSDGAVFGSKHPDPRDDKLFVILAVYVDDITIAATSDKGLVMTKSIISSAFEIKDEGDAKKVIGFELEKVANGYFLHQQTYLKNVLERFQMHGANGVTTPMENGCKLVPKRADEPEKSSTEYRQEIGALLYAVTCTRPDLAVAVSICSRFVEKPGAQHCGAVKRILRYVKKTSDYGLLYQKRESSGISLVGYCDSDFAGDTSDSRSTSGYAMLINGCLVSWRSRKQKAVSTSVVEAEYIAGCEASKELIWIRFLLEEILGGKLTEKPTMWIDNSGAWSLSQNDAMSEKTKHIRYTYHFVRDCVREGVLDLQQVATQENRADMFTKPLSRATLAEHCIGIQCVAQESLKKENSSL
jgi:Reverse transcriptase (RNA-dependent DNA polymerase)/Chromo (CHRromatin Organisation MOdifier) domain